MQFKIFTKRKEKGVEKDYSRAFLLPFVSCATDSEMADDLFAGDVT